MIDIKLIREDIENTKKLIAKRLHYSIDWNEIIKLDNECSNLKRTLEKLQQKANLNAKLFKDAADNVDEINRLKSSSKKVKEDIKQLKTVLEPKLDDLKQMLLEIPNLPDDDIPIGSEADGEVVKKWGEPTVFDFKPKYHWEIAKNLDILDFNRASKLSGSRFVVYKGHGAKLERALVNFMLDLHTEQGYEEILTPYLVKKEALIGTGQLPKFIDELYQTDDGMFLIPTAEVSLVNLHSDEILSAESLPIKYQAYSACFRKEAGSYGKDVSGIIRQHQFNKVELVKFTKPDKSPEELLNLLSDAEAVLRKLKLPYRVMKLASGDMGFSARKTYDIEVWLPAENRYREISSCSDTGDFQARRANIRYKENGENKFVHTLNGSGLAVGRTLVAIIENYQLSNGTVKIPDALIKYLGYKFIP